MVGTDSKTLETHQIHVKLPYTAGLLVFPTDSKLSKQIEQIRKFRNTSSSCETSLQWWSTSGSNRFEIFETHQIDVKVPYSGGILVVRTDSKLSKHIEFI